MSNVTPALEAAPEFTQRDDWENTEGHRIDGTNLDVFAEVHYALRANAPHVFVTDSAGVNLDLTPEAARALAGELVRLAVASEQRAAQLAEQGRRAGSTPELRATAALDFIGVTLENLGPDDEATWKAHEVTGVLVDVARLIQGFERSGHDSEPSVD